MLKQITSSRRPIIYPSGKIIAHDSRYLNKGVVIIQIYRFSAFRDSLISYKVYLDNKLVGKIKNGASLKFDTTNGSHELVLKVLWMKSQTIQFEKDKDNIYFTCGSNITGFQNITYQFWPTVNNDNYIFLEKDNKTLERNS